MDSEPTSINELVDDLAAAGIENRHVMAHSSYKAVRPIEEGPAGIVRAFANVCSVILFPTYDFHSFTDGGYWDLQESQSRMGIISETARKRPDFERSPHPILSYAIRGDVSMPSRPTTHFTQIGSFPYEGMTAERRHGYLEDVPNAHGADSVFSKLIFNDGLLVSFSGKGFRDDDVGFTASVHAMCLAGVDYRFTKCFTGVYVDDGQPSIRTYAASVCAPGFRTAISPSHVEAEREGVIKRHKLGRTEMIVASAREFHSWAMQASVKRPELFRKAVDK